MDLSPGMRISFYHIFEEERFEGVLYKVEEPTRISLKNCTKQGITLNGISVFFMTDIKDIQIIQRDSSRSVDDTPAVVSKSMEPKYKAMSESGGGPSHLRKLKDLDIMGSLGNCSEGVSSENSGDIPPPLLDQGESSQEEFINHTKSIRDLLWTRGPPLLSYVPSSYVIIDNHCTKLYNETIDALLTQRMLGVSLEGKSLGRDGTGSLLLMATSRKVFIFDILNQSEEFFTGIKSVLCSPSILKVFHDCRMMSDYLDKVLLIRPNHIYDTLGAHISFLSWAVYKGHVANYAVSVGNLAHSYLGIGGDSLFFPKYRRGHMDEDTSHWVKRPLLRSCKENAIKNVMFLLDLYVVLTEAVALPAVQASNALLSVVRDMDLPDYYTSQSNADVLPPSVMKVLPHWEEGPPSAIKQGIRVHQYVFNPDNSLIFSKHVMHSKKNDNISCQSDDPIKQ